ncbi:hypothetical protein JTB14_000009 [Gonioctena quinquepunctata]|nr:hypothetical protein JTB14_000009 [Gonioctena quinquepunctata]
MEREKKLTSSSLSNYMSCKKRNFAIWLTKLGEIDWRFQKMKVYLAAQTLSASVANALEFLSKDLQHPDFKDAAPTIELIRIIDRLFDLLNSRNPFAKGYKTPLKKSNESFWKPILGEAFEFLISLKHVNGELLPEKLPLNRQKLKKVVSCPFLL